MRIDLHFVSRLFAHTLRRRFNRVPLHIFYTDYTSTYAKASPCYFINEIYNSKLFIARGLATTANKIPLYVSIFSPQLDLTAEETWPDFRGAAARRNSITFEVNFSLASSEDFELRTSISSKLSILYPSLLLVLKIHTCSSEAVHLKTWYIR